MFLEKTLDPLWKQMAPQMQSALGSEMAFSAFREQVAAQLGDEVEVVDEKIVSADSIPVYIRHSKWSKVSTRIVMQWSIDLEGKIIGFFIKPDSATPTPAATTHLNYDTKAQLQLPFRGTWNVAWGGRTLEQNQHIVDRGQRFAYDLLITDKGKSHRGDGQVVEDYFSWNQPILAVADGTVVKVVDGLPDQKPGSRDIVNLPGNYVMLDLGKGEFALFAHLREGSVKVKIGDTVHVGEEIGRCGNSGNTSEPHLHFHLQDTPQFGDGEGLPAFFNNYISDGKLVSRGELLKGQAIRQK